MPGPFAAKSWEDFAKPDSSPGLDFCFHTVCDNRRERSLSGLAGPAPLTAHWGVPDPAAVRGSTEQVETSLSATLSFLRNRRISLFLSLPLSTLDRLFFEEGSRRDRAANEIQFACPDASGIFWGQRFC